MKSKALVLGLYINGYSIIRELAKDPSIKIVGLDYDRTSIGLVSRYLSERYVVDYNDKDEVLLNFLINYGKKQDEKTVIYPTHDFYTKLLAKYYNELQDYYYIPINPGTIPIVISKMNQYSMCEQIGHSVSQDNFHKFRRRVWEINNRNERNVISCIGQAIFSCSKPGWF